jgi:hypothetical protein
MATIARYSPNATATFSATILDAAGVAVPVADISTATITLLAGSTVVNSRTAQDCKNVNNVTINSSGGLVWSVQTADVLTTVRREHVATFLFVTTSGETISAEHRMYISPTIALTSYEDVESLLGELSTDEELLIEQMADALTDRVERFTGRKFAYVAARVETFSPGRKRTSLSMGTFPLISVASAYEELEGDFTGNALLESDDYYVDTTLGTIELRNNATFIGGPGSVQVTYEAGYPDIGSVAMDIRMACTQQVAYSFQRRSSGGITSESVNGMSVTRFVEDLLPQLKEVLGQYQTRVII